jgi:hypothetical protein
MKKNWWIIIVIVLIIIIGFSYFNKPAKQTTVNPSQSASTTTKKGLFTSIQDAMSRSLSLKCEYKNAQGSTTAYIKGTMVRATNEPADNKTKIGNVIIKDTKMWIWQEGEKTGMTLDLSGTNPGTQQTNKDKIFADLEQYKNSCSSSVVSDSIFTPPADVVFKDLSNFQEELRKQINITGVPAIPTGVPNQ